MKYKGIWAWRNFCPAKVFTYTVYLSVLSMLYYLPTVRTIWIEPMTMLCNKLVGVAWICQKVGWPQPTHFLCQWVQQIIYYSRKWQQVLQSSRAMPLRVINICEIFIRSLVLSPPTGGLCQDAFMWRLGGRASVLWWHALRWMARSYWSREVSSSSSISEFETLPFSSIGVFLCDV